MHDRSSPKRVAPPLTTASLRALALHYVGRYASTRSKLVSYLSRKIHERGWDTEYPHTDLAALAEEFAELGYVNDAAFAESRARSFVRRGYGARRLEQDLRAAGIADPDAVGARDEASNNAWQSADAFARRKRIGPYAANCASPEIRHKQLQAFLRAGHGWDLARRFVQADPGEQISPD